MAIQELAEAVGGKMARGLITPGILLSKCRLIDDASRLSSAYTDPMYVPFYYHLGTLVRPRAVVEIGFRLGLHSACFFRGCPTAENFLGFQQTSDSFYTDRLAKANVRDWYKKAMTVYVGETTDEGFQTRFGGGAWDVVLVNEETTYDKHSEYLDLAWADMADEGILVSDYLTRHAPAGQAFADFCKRRNREAAYLPTKYGVGMLQK